MKAVLAKRPSAALVISTAALFVALGGTGLAAFTLPKNSVGTKQLKKNAVTTSKIRNGAVTASKLNTSGLTVPNALHANSAGGAPPTGPAGGDLAGNYPSPGLAAGAVGTSQIGTIPAARVANSVEETISNGSAAVLTFDTNTYDNDSIHSTTANTARLTAPVSGIYEVTGQVSWGASTTGYVSALIRKDGLDQEGSDIRPPAGATVDTSQQVTAQLRLNAGEYVTLEVSQTSGGPLVAIPWFAMHWIAP